MLKKTVMLLFALVLVIGLAGSAMAANPEPTFCWFLWQDAAGNDIYPEVPGEVVYNEQSQVYNISCETWFDFGSGEYASVADMCAVMPIACNQGQQVFLMKNFLWGWFDGMDYYDVGDVTYQVNANGQASMHMQYAPGQCGSEYRSINYTYLIPDGFWTPGDHTYSFDLGGAVYPVEFTVEETAPLYDGHVRLGLALTSEEGIVDTINPAQETYIQLIYYVATIDVEYLRDFRENVPVMLSIDGGNPTLLAPSPITSYCGMFNEAVLQREWGYAR